MKKQIQIILLVLLVLTLFAVNYSFLDGRVQGFLIESVGSVFVERVIDGDTIVIENKTSVRLLGIDAPERGEKYFEESKEFLEELVLGKNVRLEFQPRKYDRYRRLLAYIYSEGKNINIELVRNGFANYYFYSGRDKYSNELIEAWNSCIEKEINLCESSKNECASCISIDRKSIVNNCNFRCDINNWEISGEGRRNFIFSGILAAGEKESFELDLTNSGGSLFLRDDEGMLVLWKG